MPEHPPPDTPDYRCFRCNNGCIHLVCGNTMLTMTSDQFLSLADSVNIVRFVVLADDEPPAAFTDESTIVM
jgi:hypothetical protein